MTTETAVPDVPQYPLGVGDAYYGTTSDGLPLTFKRPGSLIARIGETTARKLKADIVRIGRNGSRAGFKFAEGMFLAYPELRGL